MKVSESNRPGHVLRAADRFYQNVFCSNIVLSSGEAFCGAVGVACPKCGEWGEYDVRYPTINCSALLELGGSIARNIVAGDEFIYVTPDEFVDFSREILPILGPNRSAVPGMLFGTSGGWAFGKIGDFAWANKDVPVLRESVFQAVVDEGFPVAGAAMPIRVKRDLGERLILLEIPPTARLAAASGVTRCDICGKYEPGDEKIVDAELFDDSIPFQRILENPSVIVVTAALADFIVTKKFSDVAIDLMDFR